jgi:lipoate-protein ligase A
VAGRFQRAAAATASSVIGGTDFGMHGEYKTPGGKLVVVDLTVADGKLRDVMVSGDFFLYPDDAFPALSDALEGLSADLSESEIAEQVRLALPRGAELLGSSPEAIGAAVRRALAAGDEGQRG